MSQQAWKRHWKWQISQRGTGQWTDSHLYGMIHGQAWQSWLGMGRLSISIYQLMALALHSRLLQWLLMVLKRMALVLPFIGRRCSDDESGVLHFRKIWHHGKISYFSSQSKLKYHVKNLCLVIYMKLLKSTAPFEKMLVSIRWFQICTMETRLFHHLHPLKNVFWVPGSYLLNKLLLISINFTRKISHFCQTKCKHMFFR